jgi:hypothetical protein
VAEPLVFVRFRPDPKCVERLREFCGFLVESRFERPELAERARVVVHEAVENAVKYSAEAQGSELHLSIWCDGQDIEISVSGVPDPNHLDTLRAELTELYSRGAKEAYVAAFRRAAFERTESSRLGLARIRYEGELDVSMSEEKGGRVRVIASGRL